MTSATRLVSVVVDAADPPALARWWARTLGWQVSYEDEHESDVAPGPDAGPGIELVFVPVADPKAGPNRVHLDLPSPDVAAQRRRVEDLLTAGAARVPGREPTPWDVLADPEGNEFCVLDPRPGYAGTGAVAAVVVQARDPRRLGAFWVDASGWAGGSVHEGVVALRQAGTGPFLEFVASPAPTPGKNRWHLDLRATSDGPGRAAALAGLLAAGARTVDVGQVGNAEVTWDVLADPEDNEFCLLRGTV
ncbi:VOC family protein [Kineococcus gynurae]|uniref:VOC family protein n=1 Tax=Kineococcus gynurae TaxID=452979 RepID=A0ABV5LNY0_9ACTN